MLLYVQHGPITDIIHANQWFSCVWHYFVDWTWSQMNDAVKSAVADTEVEDEL